MDIQLVIVLVCVSVALIFMGMRFWRISRRKCGCGCTSEKPDPASPTCAACMEAGKMQDLRRK